jgi:hypothetical protein
MLTEAGDIETEMGLGEGELLMSPPPHAVITKRVRKARKDTFMVPPLTSLAVSDFVSFD